MQIVEGLWDQANRSDIEALEGCRSVGLWVTQQEVEHFRHAFVRAFLASRNHTMQTRDAWAKGGSGSDKEAISASKAAWPD